MYLGIAESVKGALKTKLKVQRVREGSGSLKDVSKYALAKNNTNHEILALEVNQMITEDDSFKLI